MHLAGVRSRETIMSPRCKRSWLRSKGELRVGRDGARLRTIRHPWRLSLREVEELAGLIVWSAKHTNLTVNKLIALAEIYDLPREQLLRSMCPGDPQPGLK
jgi:hypothetical protein